jgi:DNA-binding transcriptional MerR regulator
MASLSAAQLAKLMRQHVDGVSSQALVEIFQSAGERFSEPTLRKYVQMGLVPRSRRVGMKGQHRGSAGLYPVEAIRLINEIKHGLAAGVGMGHLTRSMTLLRHCQQAEASVREALARLDVASKLANGSQRSALRTRLQAERKTLMGACKELVGLAKEIGAA